MWLPFYPMLRRAMGLRGVILASSFDVTALSTLMRMSATLHALQSLAALPEVDAGLARAREACTQLRWHNALRRRTEQAAAEARVRGARASAALEGAEFSLDVVRELVMGATQWPSEPDPLERMLRANVQAVAESEHVRSIILTSPAQALARLHVAAGSQLLAAEAVGRPRTDGESSSEFVEASAPSDPLHLPSRLAGLYEVVACHDKVPALVVGAVAHAEIAVMRPFVRGNGIVARAFERALVQACGLDPTGVAVPEVGYLREGATGYAGALAAYAAGTPEGVSLWLQFSAEALQRAAVEGVRIADSVLTGRLR